MSVVCLVCVLAQDQPKQTKSTDKPTKGFDPHLLRKPQLTRKQ